ncbi:MAG TPA: fimbria/pilus outer membrane usher protein [Allosphingosinicella sp.]|nr:fimbria/pilus outer membrane usher protein [Allosphingosinicella sp.]
MSRLKRAATRLCIGVAAFATTTALAQAGGGDALRPALLEVTVNGQQQSEPVLFLQDAEGTLYASAAVLEQWRTRPPPGEPVLFEGETYYRLSSLPAIQVRLSAQDQAVAIELPPSAFEVQRAAVDQSEELPMTPAGTGAFLNYDVLVEHARGATDASGAFEAGLFTPYGVGQTSFIASAASGDERLVRLDSHWDIDRPADATSIRIGDSISSAGPGAAPVRFAGVQYFRNFAVRPGFITMPLPAGLGEASVPSVVDVYVNNVLQGSRQVAPGPFQLDNIPVPSGGGTVQLVVRDLLGREVVSEQSYYASTQMLRRGLHDFSYEAGFVRQGFGRRSNDYGEFMASTTHRYGLTDRVTAEAHVQASESRQMAGAAVNVLAFDLGQFGVSSSVSRSERGTGYRAAASFERRAMGLSLGVLSEYASADYAVIGMPADYVPPRLVLQAFADVSVARGSIGMNLLHRSLRDEPSETLAGLYGSYQVNRTASVQMFARRAVAGTSETVVGANLSLSLGPRRSASATLEHGRRGASGLVGYQESPPVGEGGGFRVAAGFGQFERLEAAYVYNLPSATLNAQVAHANGATGVRLSATGAVGVLGHDVFASRSLGETFASVTVEGHPGLKVYADNQLVGVTGADGSVVIPGLHAFQPNRIRIDETDLPLDTRIEASELIIRPFGRSGTRVRFPVVTERGVLMNVRLEDGTALPAGATVRVEGSDETYPVASGGEVYVADLSGTKRLTAAWEGGRCSFTAEVPEGDDPQPRIEGLVCRSDPAYAVTNAETPERTAF